MVSARVSMWHLVRKNELQNCWLKSMGLHLSAIGAKRTCRKEQALLDAREKEAQVLSPMERGEIKARYLSPDADRTNYLTRGWMASCVPHKSTDSAIGLWRNAAAAREEDNFESSRKLPCLAS